MKKKWKCACCKQGKPKVLPSFDAPSHCRCCVMLATATPPMQAQTPSCWPMKPSLALAVHPDQVGEAMAFDKKMGLTGVEYLPNGQPIFRGPREHAAYLKALKLHRKGRNKGALGCHSTEDPVKKVRREVEQKIKEFETGVR